MLLLLTKLVGQNFRIDNIVSSSLFLVTQALNFYLGTEFFREIIRFQ